MLDSTLIRCSLFFLFQVNNIPNMRCDQLNTSLNVTTKDPQLDY